MALPNYSPLSIAALVVTVEGNPMSVVAFTIACVLMAAGK